ncbi:MAG: SUMF1/EgtB/PvdO family nonheme iron enzyme [Pirellulales bacterium]|nr:SUMF1/EgtB/PvdO family nonheme iron enzyme [Pirellulales bacterium]
MFLKFVFRSLAAAAALTILTTTTRADTFGTGASQFTLDFVAISGSSNPTPAQTTAGNLDGFGIVEYDYRMGVHEITNGQWDSFKAELDVPVTGAPSSAYDRDFHDYGTGTIDVPANCVSWLEAAQFVNWLNTSTSHQAAYRFTGTQGTDDYTFATWDAADAWDGTNLYRHKDAFYFLPDEDEWFKAAYWNATSETIQDFATKPGDTLHQGNGSSGTGWNYYDNGYATDPYGAWNVGSGSEELNGTYDLMGNNGEWLESPHNDPSYGVGSSRGQRGGDLYDGYTHFLASSRYGGADPTYETGGLGFRVASVPEPGSITLLACGLVAALTWWRCRKQ